MKVKELDVLFFISRERNSGVLRNIFTMNNRNDDDAGSLKEKDSAFCDVRGSLLIFFSLLVPLN